MTTVGRTSVEVLQKWGTYWLSEVKSLPKSLAPILCDFEPDCQVVLLGRNTFRALLSFSNSPPIHRITCPMTGPSSTSTASPRFPVPPPGLLVPTRTIPTRIFYSSSRLPITLCTPGQFMQIAFSPMGKASNPCDYGSMVLRINQVARTFEVSPDMVRRWADTGDPTFTQTSQRRT